jgi:hypothetical protein
MTSTQTLPKHINLTIEHQPHATNYESVAEWIGDCWNTADLVDRETMLATGQVWVVHWYPQTPIGSHAVAASTLELALEAANKIGSAE